MTTERYLIIRHVKVQAANARATPWLVNTCPVFAAAMFGHALSKQLDLSIDGVAYIHHDAQILGEWFFGRFSPQQRRGAVFIDKADYASTNKHALSAQPSASMHAKATFVFKIGNAAPTPPLNKVKEVIFDSKFAGGQIIDIGNIFISGPADAISQIGAGFVTIDRTALLAERDDGEDRLDTLLRHVYQREVRDQWLTPAVTGYATITGFAKRRGGREGKPHAFCEALVGLVEYRSLRALKNSQPLPLWQYSWPSDDVFLISQGNN